MLGSTKMAVCSRCGAETQLYDGGSAVCIKCSDLWETKRKAPLRILDFRSVLHESLIVATGRSGDAAREFEDAISQFPTGLPSPDGVQRIKNASEKLSYTRKAVATAHNQLYDYLSRGIIPEELKRSG